MMIKAYKIKGEAIRITNKGLKDYKKNFWKVIQMFQDNKEILQFAPGELRDKVKETIVKAAKGI